MSAILAIAFSLATIIFIEVRGSGYVLRTEPALYAVQGTTEEAFLNYKQLPAGLRAYTTGLNGVVLNSPGPTVKTSPGSPLLDTIVPGSKKYEIIDSANLYEAARFGTLKVSYLHGSGQLSAQLTEINPHPDQSCGGTATLSGTLNSPASQPFFTNLDSCLQYELVLSNSGTANIDVKIDTTAKGDPGIADGQPKGLPYIGSTVLEVTANYRGLTRKYLVSIPNQ